MKKISNIIKNIRKKSKLTQSQFGELFDVSNTAVCNWEAGLRVPNIFMIKRICKKLNVSYYEIMDFDEEE